MRIRSLLARSFTGQPRVSSDDPGQERRQPKSSYRGAAVSVAGSDSLRAYVQRGQRACQAIVNGPFWSQLCDACSLRAWRGPDAGLSLASCRCRLRIGRGGILHRCHDARVESIAAVRWGHWSRGSSLTLSVRAIAWASRQVQRGDDHDEVASNGRSPAAAGGSSGRTAGRQGPGIRAAISGVIVTRSNSRTTSVQPSSIAQASAQEPVADLDSLQK